MFPLGVNVIQLCPLGTNGILTPTGQHGRELGVRNLKTMAKAGKGNTQITVILPDATYLEVVELAGEKDWSVSQTVRNIVDDWLKTRKAALSDTQFTQSSKKSKSH
jgi:hypothetical protein